MVRRAAALCNTVTLMMVPPALSAASPAAASPGQPGDEQAGGPGQFRHGGDQE
jgi:hypothetical protein